MSAQTTTAAPAISKHTIADAMHRLADLIASDRLEEGPGLWHVAATDTAMAEDIAAAMTDVAILVDDDDQPVWSGYLLGQCLYVRIIAPEPVEVAAAALTPDLVGGV